jgi:hypothetical protein
MKSFSQFHQDVLVHALLTGLNAIGPTPTYIDLATNRAIQSSNTYMFDTLRWKGTCIEPNPMYHQEIQSYRTCTLHKICIADQEKEYDFVTSGGPTGHIKGRQLLEQTDKVLCRRLDSLALPSHINYLSLDIEGHELVAMKTWNWTRSIDVITAENPSHGLIRFLRSHGMMKLACISLDGVFVRNELLPAATMWVASRYGQYKNCLHPISEACNLSLLSSCCQHSFQMCRNATVKIH